MIFKKPIWKYTILAVVFSVTLYSSYQLKYLEFKFQIESLFPTDNEDLDLYNYVKDKFESDQPTLIFVIENDQSIFDEELLIELKTATEYLENFDGVSEVHSLVNLKMPIKHPLGFIERPVIRSKNKAEISEDSVRLASLPDVYEKFVSKSGRSTLVLVYYDRDVVSADKIRTSFESRRFNFNKLYWFGDNKSELSSAEKLRSEMILLSLISLFLIVILLRLMFKSFRAVLLSFFLISIVVVWTLGIMSFLGIEINAMTVLIPSVISIVGLSDVVHVLSRAGEKVSSDSIREHLTKVYKDLQGALLITSVTTAIGFLTLTISSIKPFIMFGLFTSMGVLLAYVFTMMVFPIFLELLPIRTSEEKGGSNILKNLFQITQSKYRGIVVISLVILLVFGFLASKLRVDSKVFENFASGDEMSEVLVFFEKEFSGIRSFELYGKINEGEKLFEYNTLMKLDSLETYLRDVFELNEVYSPVIEIKRLNRSHYLGNPEKFVVPDDSEKLKMYGTFLQKNYDEMGLKPMISEDFKEFRVLGKIQDIGSAEIKTRNDLLLKYLNENFSGMEFRLTGSNHLLDRSNELIARNLLFGLGGAILLISMLMGFLFRSIRITLIALISNIFPLVLIAGILSVFGFGISISTAIIFTIVFGIAVDDTIHILSRFMVERKKSDYQIVAFRESYLSSGRAVLRTSIILICGFSVLIFSSFHGTVTNGIFIGLGMIFALVADILFMPALVRMILFKNENDG